MDAAQIGLLVAITTGLLALLGAVVTGVRRARAWWEPKGARIETALDTLGGRPAVHDPVGGGNLPAIVPLHTRLLTIEATQRDQAAAQRDQAAALRAVAEVNTALAELSRSVADHDARLVSLEDVEAERTLAREESTAMWRAVDHRDVIDSEGTEL